MGDANEGLNPFAGCDLDFTPLPGEKRERKGGGV